MKKRGPSLTGLTVDVFISAGVVNPLNMHDNILGTVPNWMPSHDWTHGLPVTDNVTLT